MTTEELKEWMDERFKIQTMSAVAIALQLEKMNDKITSHDRWLWLIRGILLAITGFLTFIGFKIRL